MVHDLEQKFISTRISKNINDAIEDENTEMSEMLNYVSSEQPETQ